MSQLPHCGGARKAGVGHGPPRQQRDTYLDRRGLRNESAVATPRAALLQRRRVIGSSARAGHWPPGGSGFGAAGARGGNGAAPHRGREFLLIVRTPIEVEAVRPIWRRCSWVEREVVRVAIAEPVAAEPASAETGSVAEVMYELQAHLAAAGEALYRPRDGAALRVAIAVHQLEVGIVVRELDHRGARRRHTAIAAEDLHNP